MLPLRSHFILSVLVHAVGGCGNSGPSIPFSGQFLCLFQPPQFDVCSSTEPHSLQALLWLFFLLRLLVILEPRDGVVSAPERSANARQLQVWPALKNRSEE